MNQAEDFFDKRAAYLCAEDEIEDAIMRALGVGPDLVDSWPLTDFSFDQYDSSFELHGVTPGWLPPEGSWEKMATIGFHCSWINYTDGSERAWNAGGLSELRPPKKH